MCSLESSTAASQGSLYLTRPSASIMLAQSLALLAGALHLPEGAPTLSFGAGNQARVQASCSLATPTVVAVSPQTLNGPSLPATVKVYINGLPHCADVLSLRAPCVPHTTELPALFWCMWTGEGSNTPATTGPVRASFEAVTSPSSQSVLSLQGTALCPVPDYLSLTPLLMSGAMSGHFNVSISYFEAVGHSLATPLPFAGAPGGERVAISGLVAPPPPTPPSPPPSPPPPLVSPAYWFFSFDDSSSPYRNSGSSGQLMDLSGAQARHVTARGAGALDLCR